MNEILGKVFLDNTLKQYIIVGITIAIVFLAKRFIAHSVAGVLCKLIRHRWETFDVTTFKNLVAKPLGLFLAVFITVVSLDKLSYPHQLEFDIYGAPIQRILQKAGTGAIIISFFLFLIKCTDFSGLAIHAGYSGDAHRSRSQLIFFFKDFFKVLLGTVAGLLILKYCFSYDIKSLVTGLSIVGAAVALALKENLENLIASFIIFFDKPFTAGDVVSVNNITGTVEKIGLRSTRIRSDEKTYITVPNKQMSDSILNNLSNRTQRRAILKLELDETTGEQKIEKLLNGLKDIVKKEEVQNATVFVSDITATAIVVTTEYFTAPIAVGLFNHLKQTVYLQALALMETLGIELAGSSTLVNIGTPGPTPPPPSKIL